jgi:bifunctional non-homologous end joining protein LigD
MANVCACSRADDWSAQLPTIFEAMRALPVTSVTLDGEVVICGSDGLSQFDRMRAVFGRRGSRKAFPYAFDIIELDGRDLRGERWYARRTMLVRLDQVETKKA